ncbi:MAG: trypsin-like serine protease, partial [Pseudomonadota bacterium]
AAALLALSLPATAQETAAAEPPSLPALDSLGAPADDTATRIAERRRALAVASARAALAGGGWRARSATRWLEAAVGEAASSPELAIGLEAGAEGDPPGRRADPDLAQSVHRQIDRDPVYQRWLAAARPGPLPDVLPPRGIGPRVSYGADLTGAKMPDVVALTRSNGTVQCTGILLNRDTVMTAAHCYCEGAPAAAVIGLSTDAPVARIPLASQRALPAGMEPPSRFGSVSACKRAAVGQDIALARLSKTVTSRQARSIVPIANGPEIRSVRNGSTLAVVGFGHTETGRIGQKALTSVPITNWGCSATGGVSGSAQTGCRRNVEFVSVMIDRTPARPSAGPCAGDSGGPAMMVRGQRFRVIGLVSRGSRLWGQTRCGDVAVYTLLGVSARSFLSQACRQLTGTEPCPRI